MKRELREYQKRERRRVILRLVRVLAAAVIAVAVGLLNYYFPFRDLVPALELPLRQEGEMRLHFLDVGQGDCTIAELVDGSFLVIDGGNGDFQNNQKIKRYLRGLGAKEISILCTHADYDHSGGLSSLFESFQVQKVYLPPVSSENSSYLEFLELAGKAGAETVKRYDVIAGGESYCVCLSPYSVEEGSSNAASAVLYFSYRGATALLCSDIPAEREALLLREYAMYPPIFDSGEYTVRLENIDVLKVAHHGSGGSTSDDWLSLLSPASAVISCGRYNGYGHPALETLERLAAHGADIYRIDELGDVVLTVSPDGSLAFSYGDT